MAQVRQLLALSGEAYHKSRHSKGIVEASAFDGIVVGVGDRVELEDSKDTFSFYEFSSTRNRFGSAQTCLPAHKAE